MPAIPERVFGLPGKPVVIGGGALLGVGIIILRQRRAAAAASADTSQTTAGASDPTAGGVPSDPSQFYSDLAQSGTGFFPTGYTGLGVGGVPTSTDSSMLNNPDAYTTLVSSLTDTITTLAGITPPPSRTPLPQPINVTIQAPNASGSTTAPKPPHVTCTGGSIADARNPKRCYCPPSAKFWDAKTKRCVAKRPK